MYFYKGNKNPPVSYDPLHRTADLHPAVSSITEEGLSDEESHVLGQGGLEVP